jgi:GntR family transcriptional regulator, arabinose operon transcriptional repressor
MGTILNNNDPAHLYEQVERDIMRQIKDKSLKPGDLVGTHAELSQKYLVSIITIKKAISNLINAGYLYSRTGKGTFVAEMRENKIDFNSHNTIGLVLRDLKHPYFSLIVHGIEERAYELGYNLLITSSSNNPEKEENQINHFLNLGVDGLIIASLSLQYRATDYIQKLHNNNFPYVMVSYIHDPEYWYVGSNHELGGFLATDHLIRTGYKKIGYVHVGKGNLLSDVRKNGYMQALLEHDIPFDSKLVYFLAKEMFDSGLDRFELGEEFGNSFVDILEKPDAIYFYNDAIALGFEKAVMEKGIRIPDDIAIIGNDDILNSNYASVPLTTIHQPADLIGKKAVDVIKRRIDGIDVENRIVLKPSLIVRDSCGAKKRWANKSSFA